MTDTNHRCGTCQHFTPPATQFNTGKCAIGEFLGWGNAYDGETGCPAWSDGTEYARGWREAIDAAKARIQEEIDASEFFGGIDAAELLADIAALTQEKA